MTTSARTGHALHFLDPIHQRQTGDGSQESLALCLAFEEQVVRTACREALIGVALGLKIRDRFGCHSRMREELMSQKLSRESESDSCTRDDKVRNA